MRRQTALILVTVAAVIGMSFAVLAAEETRDVKGFTAVNLAGSGDVDITVGKEFSLVLSGAPEVLAHIETEVKHDALYIGRERGSWLSFGRSKGKFHAKVTMPSLSTATLAGSGDIRAERLQGGSVKFVLSGSGDLSAVGEVERVVLNINGSGDGHFGDLKADGTVVTINGSGDMVVRAEKSLTATINGSGSIEYIGAPAKLATSVRGSGKIRQH